MVYDLDEKLDPPTFLSQLKFHEKIEGLILAFCPIALFLNIFTETAENIFHLIQNSSVIWIACRKQRIDNKFPLK